MTGSRSLGSLWGLGFGQIHLQTIVGGWAFDRIHSPTWHILADVLVANTPQAALSLVYVLVNSILTTMLTAREWNDFATQRKALRVSKPQGQQRQTYYLQLPYRFAIPLMVIMGLLHWLLSQSVFLAVVARYDALGRRVSEHEISTCGFSPIAMICALTVSGILVLVIGGLGLRKYKNAMPLAASCSMAMSAACHGSEPEAHLVPLQWGVKIGAQSVEGREYCCFSSQEVAAPVNGNKYGGYVDTLDHDGDLPRPRESGDLALPDLDCLRERHEILSSAYVV